MTLNLKSLFLPSAQWKSDFENRSNSSALTMFFTIISLVLHCALRYSSKTILSLHQQIKKGTALTVPCSGKPEWPRRSIIFLNRLRQPKNLRSARIISPRFTLPKVMQLHPDNEIVPYNCGKVKLIQNCIFLALCQGYYSRSYWGQRPQ